MRQMAAMQRRFLDIARREQRERRQQQHEEDRDEEDDGFGEDMAADTGEELSEAGPSIPYHCPRWVSVWCVVTSGLYHSSTLPVLNVFIQ